jgi:hypothetical protein
MHWCCVQRCQQPNYLHYHQLLLRADALLVPEAALLAPLTDAAALLLMLLLPA